MGLHGFVSDWLFFFLVGQIENGKRGLQVKFRNSPRLFRKTEKVNKILAQSTEPCSFIITEDKPGASSCNWQRTQLLTDICCSYLPYPNPSTENSVTAATKQELWYGSSSIPAPETAATAPIQLSLQSSSHSSKPSAPGLFLTTSSKPCCFPFCFWVQEQTVKGWQKLRFAYVSEECWAGCMNYYLPLLLQLMYYWA